MDKKNIYVPQHIGQQLDYDASMFEIVKRDGRTINRNKFLSMLIIGYYNTYITECQASHNAIARILEGQELEDDKRQSIAEQILNKVVLPDVPYRKGKNTTKLSLKPTQDTEGLIQSIQDSLGINDSVSNYFCRMLMSYCQEPFSIREQIVFKDNYGILADACERRQPVSFTTIWNKTVVHTVIPYRLVIGQEELFNYLLCAEVDNKTGRQETRSYRLNRITSINYSGATNQIDAEVKDHLDRMMKYGPQYMINDDEETCVRLTESGKRNFHRIYYGRPKVDRIEEKEDGEYYYFKGSKNQLFLYFRRFGKEAEIISPESLRGKMANYYSEACELYRESETSAEIRNVEA